MEMTSLNISLPKPMREFVESQVQRGGYSTPSEYVRALLREERRRQAEDEIERLLLEGMESGPSMEATPAYWRKKRRDLLHQKPRKGAR